MARTAPCVIRLNEAVRFRPVCTRNTCRTATSDKGRTHPPRTPAPRSNVAVSSCLGRNRDERAHTRRSCLARIRSGGYTQPLPRLDCSATLSRVPRAHDNRRRVCPDIASGSRFGEPGSAPSVGHFEALESRPRLSVLDQLLWIVLRRLSADWRSALVLVQPHPSFGGIGRTSGSTGAAARAATS